MPRLLLCCAFLALLCSAVAWSLRTPTPERRWYKGCTHVHTLWSDADGAPELVADWYKQQGYQFLVLSDHNVMQLDERWFGIDDPADPRLCSADVTALCERFGVEQVSVREHEGHRELRLLTLAELQARFEQPEQFLLIPGEEISDGSPQRPVHVNGLNLAEVIPPQGGANAREMAENDLAAIVAQGERLARPVLGHLNHPNFRWALTSDDVAQLKSERFFEVYNGHPGTHGHGAAGHPGNEELWDLANARRRYELDLPLLYGLATDDAHDHHSLGPDKSNCGRGWIQVHARELSAGALIEALRAGEFYASTGAVLEELRFDGKTLSVDIACEPGVSYTTRFLGARSSAGVVSSGCLFLETQADPATYTLTGSEGYVRATVVSSRAQANPAAAGDLECAWTQPVRVD